MPLAAGVWTGDPAKQLSAVQTSLSDGTSVSSSALMVAPVPSQTTCLQSPGTCIAVGVSARTNPVEQVPPVHSRVTHGLAGTGQSVGTVQVIPPELELLELLLLLLELLELLELELLELELLLLEDEVDPPAPPEPPVPELLLAVAPPAPPVPELVAAPPVPVAVVPVVSELVLEPPDPPVPPMMLRSTEEMSSHAAVVETRASTQGTRR